jgi:hypothetical protein
MKTYLAIGSFKVSNKGFRYADTAVDIVAFARYVSEIYPDFDIDCIVLVDEKIED